jgi:hypothetical protein
LFLQHLLSRHWFYSTCSQKTFFRAPALNALFLQHLLSKNCSTAPALKALFLQHLLSTHCF